MAAFRNREGHCRVPISHVENGYKLGSWVSVQRKSGEVMPSERKRRLDALGFDWDPLASAWEEGFAELEKFKAREGHLRVPQRFQTERVSLGSWVGKQRQDKDTMRSDRKQRLDAIGFIWDPRAAAWEEGLSALEKFKAREGHCLVPAKHVEDGFKLGFWVRNQRANRSALSQARRLRLEALGFAWRAM